MGGEHWRLQGPRYQLIGEVCNSNKCGGRVIFPPRDICPDCGKEAKEPFQLSGRGIVYSATVVKDAPQAFEEDAPYPVAIVQLEEGPKVIAQLTDLGDKKAEIGMPVEMVTRRLKREGDFGQLVYGYKFRPKLTQ